MVDIVEPLLQDALANYNKVGAPRELSSDFKKLSSAQKNELLSELVKRAVPQKDIARLFSISPSAVSQRLNPSTSTAFLANIKRMEDLQEAGFSIESIASLLSNSGLDISPEEINTLFKVKRSFESL